MDFRIASDIVACMNRLIPSGALFVATKALFETATVSSAADIVESHSLLVPGKAPITGRNSSGQAVIQFGEQDDSLKCFISARISTDQPLVYLMEGLMETFEISESGHLYLLQTLLTEPDDFRVEIAFAKRGLLVEISRDLGGM